MGVIDQILFSFVLLTGDGDEEAAEALLPPDELDDLLATDKVQAWLKAMKADVVLAVTRNSNPLRRLSPRSSVCVGRVGR